MMILPFELPDWPWGGTVASARLYSFVDWADENGVYRMAGEMGTTDFYQEFLAIVSGRSLLFEEGWDTPATTLAKDRRAGAVLVGCELYDETTVMRKELFKSWEIPHTLDPSTFANLAIFNHARRCVRLADRYLPDVGVYAAIQSAIEGIVLQNMPVAQGLAELVDGSVVVEEPLVGVFSRIFPSSQDANVSGYLSAPMGADRVVGESFTIRSTNRPDNGFVAWTMFEP